MSNHCHSQRKIRRYTCLTMPLTGFNRSRSALVLITWILQKLILHAGKQQMVVDESQKLIYRVLLAS